ncbi:MAG: hypothetical protein AAFP20_25430 [Cyanobacteria bacterium J06614_10]
MAYYNQKRKFDFDNFNQGYNKRQKTSSWKRGKYNNSRWNNQHSQRQSNNAHWNNQHSPSEYNNSHWSNKQSSCQYNNSNWNNRNWNNQHSPSSSSSSQYFEGAGNLPIPRIEMVNGEPYFVCGGYACHMKYRPSSGILESSGPKNTGYKTRQYVEAQEEKVQKTATMKKEFWQEWYKPAPEDSAGA